jgi:hypothetical protein
MALLSAAAYGFPGDDWAVLARDSRNLAMALRRFERSEEMVLGVESLERRQTAARERLETLLLGNAGSAKAVDSDPMGPENRPHQYTYKLSPNPEQDTVLAPEACNATAGQAVGSSPPLVQQEPAEQGRVLKLRPDELVRLAPRLRPYLGGERGLARGGRRIVVALPARVNSRIIRWPPSGGGATRWTNTSRAPNHQRAGPRLWLKKRKYQIRLRKALRLDFLSG